ncbi:MULTISPECIES: hypothetical protein [unclassified Sphingomonas]|nr:MULTISPECIES: hypothetical protein [unclassified Sphingomonas]
MDEKKKENLVEETLDEVFTDPDSAKNHQSKTPPQTIEAEDEDED